MSGFSPLVRNYLSAAIPMILVALVSSVVECQVPQRQGDAHVVVSVNGVEIKQILTTARQRYYNLRQAGLVEFQVNIKPNWQKVADFGSNDDALKVLEAMRFLISVDPEIKLRINHQSDLVPTTQKSADYVDRIYKGMDEAVSSFFGQWTIFMLTSPFPPIDSDYAIRQDSNQYQISQRQGDADVVITTNREFKVLEIKVSGDNYKASLKPVLDKTVKGFLLKGYTANYERLDGARATTVKALLEYEEINGLQLLHKVNLDTVFQGNPAQVEWLFTDYQVKVH